MVKIKKVKIASICLFIILIIVLNTVAVFIQRQNSDLEQIKLEELENIIKSKNTDVQYVYIGRDSCPTCNTVYPILCSISKEKDLSIMYYSTEEDREKRPQKMYELLKKIEVKSVPTVIGVTNGTIKEKYDGEEFIKIFS